MLIFLHLIWRLWRGTVWCSNKFLQVGMGASSEHSTFEKICPTTNEEWRYDGQEGPGDDLCVWSFLWVHLLVIYDHVAIPGTSGGHEVIPNVSAGICSDELTEGIDGTKTSTRFSRTLENQRGDGEVDARFYVTAEKGSERASVDEEGAAGGIAKARGNGSGVD